MSFRFSKLYLYQIILLQYLFPKHIITKLYYYDLTNPLCIITISNISREIDYVPNEKIRSYIAPRYAELVGPVLVHWENYHYGNKKLIIGEYAFTRRDGQYIDFGKVNMTFSQFVVDFVFMALLFDAWSSHSLQFAPTSYVSGVPAAVYKQMKNNREIIVHYLQSNQVSYAGKIVLLEFRPICILTNSYTYHFAKLPCIHVNFPTGNSVFGEGPDWDMPKLKKLFST